MFMPRCRTRSQRCLVPLSRAVGVQLVRAQVAGGHVEDDVHHAATNTATRCEGECSDVASARESDTFPRKGKLLEMPYQEAQLIIMTLAMRNSTWLAQQIDNGVL